MSLSSEAQALFDHAINSLPRWLTGAPSAALEWLFAQVEIMDEVRIQGQAWLDITYLNNATGAELDQHALDRGTTRRSGESDSALRERLKNISDVVTEPALKIGVDAVLDSLGFLAKFKVNKYVTTGTTTQYQVLNTLSAGGWQTNVYLSMINDNTDPPTISEVQSIDGKTMTVTIHYKAGTTTRAAVETLVTSSSGVFSVFSASASGGTALTAGDAFSNKRFWLSAMVSLRRDRAHFHIDGSCKAFMSRGYRMCNINRPMGYIFIIPYPANAATQAAIQEYLRKNGPAGYQYYVERRLNP